MKTYPKYDCGDRVADLTFDPSPEGVIVGRHGTDDAYYVRLDGGKNDVIIHARNLRKL